MLKKKEFPSNSLPTATEKTTRGPSESGTDGYVHAPQANSNSTAVEKKVREPLPEVKYKDKVDKLLDGLGPRYTDWPGCDPLPVDADMLPAVVPGYQPPFRVLPYGVRSTLGAKGATNLRRLAMVLPPHFALGRNRHLQGLAMAMIKLWERSSIAKIALKRGAQLTTSESTAEEIKKLTGGILLSRNKDFLVFYRGKNFLSPDVTEALLERERLAKSLQDEEEQARLRGLALIIPRVEITEQSGIAGTLEETLDANARWGKTLDDCHEKKMMREAEVLRHADLVRKLENKLTAAERKVARAERAFSKVEESLKPAERQAGPESLTVEERFMFRKLGLRMKSFLLLSRRGVFDGTVENMHLHWKYRELVKILVKAKTFDHSGKLAPESLTDEERFMFRKLGLRMKSFLLLSRRGVFDGTVENMHLHWKYRELVKILVKAKTFDHVKKIALALEAESRGVLVSVDKVCKGYAIIVFRGNKYKRPAMLRPKNLLTKGKALARSIELQRREALLTHISALQRKVERIRSEIEQMGSILIPNLITLLIKKFIKSFPLPLRFSEFFDEESYRIWDKDTGFPKGFKEILLRTFRNRVIIPSDIHGRPTSFEIPEFNIVDPIGKQFLDLIHVIAGLISNEEISSILSQFCCEGEDTPKKEYLIDLNYIKKARKSSNDLFNFLESIQVHLTQISLPFKKMSTNFQESDEDLDRFKAYQDSISKLPLVSYDGYQLHLRASEKGIRTSTNCWEQLLSEGHVKECSGSESLSRYELNVDLLHVHADKSTRSRLRGIFLKQDNLIQGYSAFLENYGSLKKNCDAPTHGKQDAQNGLVE
ncbi:hypothetical protein CMV_012270 [Castanea mollissima]|uniref:CRM domain-containing protein n=1 Tax=Castanea mollissima TaxID=60419 RepID=A0A8J4RIV5_9ROSI|nr:hypothetical protein CMV_012270 [Castanea mollissima]